MPGMSITFTPTQSTVYIFASATARLTNSSGSAQMGQVLMYIRAVNVNTGAEVGRAGTNVTDYDDANGLVVGGTAAFNGVPISVTPAVSTTIKIQWRGTFFWANSPYQLRIDPGAANLGDHASFLIME
jgi:hypothetical protein